MNDKINTVSLLVFLSFLGLGCNAAMNPPKVPGNVVAPEVKLLWTEDDQDSGIGGSMMVETHQGLGLGINNGILATVDQKAITLKDFDSIFIPQLQNLPPGMHPKDLYHQVLNNLIINQLLLAYGRGLEDVEISDHQVDLRLEKLTSGIPGGWVDFRKTLYDRDDLTLLEFRDIIKERLLIERVQAEIFRGLGSASPKEIRDEYEKRKGEFTSEEERDVSLIVVFNSTYEEKEEQLDQLLTRISNDLKTRPFAEVAKKYSEGLKAEEGGRQGWIKRKDLAPDLSEVAFSLSKEQKSGPHKMKDFSFFIYCHEAKYGNTKSMSEVQPLLEKSIQNRKRQALMEAKLKELYELHHVQELSPEDYMKHLKSLQRE